MFLPWMKYSARIPEYQQTRFSGIERGKADADGSIYDLQNISTDDFPILTASPNRKYNKISYSPLWYYGVAEKEFFIAGESADFENETWVPGKTHSEGDIVGHNGVFFIAIRDVTGDATTQPPHTAAEYWAIYTNITFAYDEVWDWWHKCRPGDVVAHKGRFYRSKTGKNIKLYDDSTNWHWYSISTGPQSAGTYSNSVTYTRNQYVKYKENYYICIADNVKNIAPDSSDAVNAWKYATWDYTAEYNIGDDVISMLGEKWVYRFRNKTGKNTSPETDTANWEPYTYASFCYDGRIVEGLHLSPGKKECAYLNGHIVIMPDGVYYKEDDGTFGYLNGSKSGKFDTKDYRGIYINGKKFDYPMVATLVNDSDMNKIKLGFWGGNTISVAGDYSTVDLTKIFRSGDAIEINQQRQEAHRDYAIIPNGTYYVETVKKDELIFTVSAFAGADIGEEATIGSGKYYYLGDAIFSKGMPDMDYLCVSNNRMWGCHEDTVYSSALGDVFIWQRYSGLETDPVYIETGDLGSFTGCYEYNGYPIFFKENEMFRLYGSTSSQFALQKVADYGLMKGSPHAVCTVDSVLYFLSPHGICAYTGGVPAVISDGLHRDLSDGVFGTDGKKLFASVNDGEKRIMYVYDTQNRVWSSETYDEMPLGVTNFNNELRIIDSQGNLMLFSKSRSEWNFEADTNKSVIEFNDFYNDSVDSKRVSGVSIRASVNPEYDALIIYVQYDSDGEWHKVGSIYNQDNRKRVAEFNFFPMKCDHFRIRLECNGKFALYSIVRQLEG